MGNRTYDSRRVDPIFHTDFIAGPAMHGGEDILSLDNRYMNVAATVAERPHLGQVIGSRLGNLYVYVQMTGGAAVAGAGLAPAADVAEDTVASSSDLRTITTGGVDTTWVAGAFVGDLVYVDAGTGAGQLRRIVANTTTELTLDYALTTALAIADSDITIIRPYRVRTAVAGIVAKPLAGVALSAITQDYFSYIQVKGIANVLLDEAVAAYALLTIDANDAGEFNDLATATVGVGEATPMAMALAAGAAGQLAPAALSGFNVYGL